MKYIFSVSQPKIIEVNANSEEEARKQILAMIRKTEYDYVEIQRIYEVEDS